MLLELVWLQEIVQFKTSQFIDSTCTSMHGWFIYIIYGSQFVTLSGDRNEVFEYLVLQSLLSTANFRKSNRQNIFFSFWTFDFYGFIIVHTKAFSLWRRQKYHQRGTLIESKITFLTLTCAGWCPLDPRVSSFASPVKTRQYFSPLVFVFVCLFVCFLQLPKYQLRIFWWTKNENGWAVSALISIN